jgi:hypothetical protein
MKILRTIKRRKPNWIGHICLIKHVIERIIEGMRRLGRGVSSYWIAISKRENTGL